MPDLYPEMRLLAFHVTSDSAWWYMRLSPPEGHLEEGSWLGAVNNIVNKEENRDR